MNNNVTKLPFDIPKYKTYPLNTAINGILRAHEDDEIWLYNNYISLWMYSWRKQKEYMVDFKYDMNSKYYEVCPMLKITIIELEKNDNIIDVIIEKIGEKKYIFLGVDVYFIDIWWNNIDRKSHSQHQMLIIGYDNEKKDVFVADFFKRKYSIQRISYIDFRKAFDANMGYIRQRDGMEKIPICMYEYLKDDNYTLNAKRIKNMTFDFINSCEKTIKDDSDLFTVKEDVVYGSECLNHIVLYFKECIYKNEWLDYRIIHLIFIFNDIMFKRIDYLIKNKYVLENELIKKVRNNFKDLSKRSEILRSLVIKYNLKKELIYGELLIKKIKETFVQLEINLRIFYNCIENIKD